MPAGAVRKMSLAVLVDQAVTWKRDKNESLRVLVPPPPEKLKIIRDLVAGVTGFSAERGDQLVIETLPFETTLLLEPPQPAGAPGSAKPAPPPGWTFKLDQKTLLMAGGALAAVLLFGFGAIVLLRRGRSRGTAEDTGPTALPAPLGVAAVSAGAKGQPIEEQIESKLAEREALQQKMDAQALNALKLAPVITKKAEVFAKHLREKIKSEPDISAQVLRSWIREEEG
jgi:flagellar M-ring protein FliF